MQEITKKYQIWVYNSDNGYTLYEYDTLKECLLHETYSSKYYITKKVEFDVEELVTSYMQVRNPWNIDDTDDLLKILGRPVTLEDILIAAKKVINNKPEAFFVPYHIIVSDVVIKSRWHLGKPLHNQSVETLQFIRDILK